MQIAYKWKYARKRYFIVRYFDRKRLFNANGIRLKSSKRMYETSLMHEQEWKIRARNRIGHKPDDL